MDIDANWTSDYAPTEIQLVQSLQDALMQANIDLTVRMYRMYGTGRSAGFEFLDPKNNEVIFTMDMDVNRPTSETRMYTIEGISFRGVAVNQMLSDKLSAVSSEKVFRRIKDVVDLFYLSHCTVLDVESVLRNINSTGRVLGTFEHLFLRQEELRHAYDKFRFGSNVSKPDFDEVYERVC